MTVYVLQEMGRNIRSAEKFGDLKVVLPDNRQIILSAGPMSFKIQQELKDFNSKETFSKTEPITKWEKINNVIKKRNLNVVVNLFISGQ